MLKGNLMRVVDTRIGHMVGVCTRLCGGLDLAFEI